MAGTDCGLGPRVGDPQIAWAKFAAMAEGARIASQGVVGKMTLERAVIPERELQIEGGTLMNVRWMINVNPACRLLIAVRRCIRSAAAKVRRYRLQSAGFALLCVGQRFGQGDQ